MAQKRRLYDATQTHFFAACPSCGQKYALFGLTLQDHEELSCSRCNAIFRLRIDGDRVEAYGVTGATGAPLGPAEGPNRR